MNVIVISFALYTLLIVAIGVYSSRYAKRSDEDYFLAGRSLGPWIAALSSSASTSSGWVTMGLVGFGFLNGVQAYWLIPGVAFGIALNWFVLAAKLRDRAYDLGAVTIPDLFAFHFRERLPLLRVLSVIVVLSSMFLYVAAQMAAAGKAFQAGFDGVDYQVGVIIGMIVVLAYTVLGGFRAACWTDFLQALLMLTVLLVMPIYLLFAHGGYEFVIEHNSAANPTIVQFFPQKSGLAMLGFLLGSGALGINFGSPGQPHALVRYMAMRDRREAVIGGVISLAWAALIYWGAVTVGLFSRALTEAGAEWGAPMLENPEKNGELALVISAMNLLPGMVAGMALAAVLAAIASTADSQLIVAASSVANDLYARLFERTGRRGHMLINRSVVFILGLGAGLLVVDQNIRVYTYVLTYGWAMLGASFGPQLILLLLWKRATYAGCLAGMITGFAVAILWPSVYNAEATGVEAYNLTVAFFAAIFVNVLVSLATSKQTSPTSARSE